MIARSGGNAYFQGQPALQVGNGGDGQNTGTVNDATVTGNTIIQSVYDSIGFSTSTSTDLADNTITSGMTFGRIWLNMMRSLELFAREVYPAIRELGESHQHVEAGATVGG